MVKGLTKSQIKAESILSEHSQGPGFLNEILPPILNYHCSHLGLDLRKVSPIGQRTQRIKED